jgi:hypothetical protein
MKSNSKWNLEPQGIMAQNIVTKTSQETPPPFKKISNSMVVLVSYLSSWALIHYEKNLPKILDLLIFSNYSLNFSLEFLELLKFSDNLPNINKFLPPQRRKTLHSY